MDELITEKIRGFEIKLKIRPGMFSKKGVDAGSRLLIEKAKIADKTMIADLGCGSGIIGFVGAKLNPSGHIHLLDVNLRAVESAKENAALNNLSNVEVFLSDIFSAVSGRTYHQIFCNPPQHQGAALLEEMAGECFRHLKPGGATWWVVQKHLSAFIKRIFEKTFSKTSVIFRGQDHVLLIGEKQ